MNDNPHNIPLPLSVRSALRKTLLIPYNFLTPYLAAKTPFPEDRVFVNSYSYHGEDLLIDAILGCKQKGRYIDIGANDPVFRNNTKRFSKRGWTGINVEPCIQKFRDIVVDRPQDLNVNIALSDTDGTIPFYVLEWDMASTLDKEVAIHHCKEHSTIIKEIVDTPTMRFDTFLEDYNGGMPIDFVSMDIETHELAVLKTNNWDKYRPTLFCIELCYDLAEDVTEYMISKGYHPVLQTEENGFYIDGELK